MKRILSAPVKHIKRIGSLRSEKRIISQFADQFGLVYFGYVSQRDDEHRIVRGMTLSTNHRDDHYCLGTYEDYDVIYVERTDTLKSKTKTKDTLHKWHIFAFDLRTKIDLPHVFVGLHTHSEEFYMQLFAKFPTVRQLTLGHTKIYPAGFAANHRVFGSPADAIAIEHVVTPEVATIVSEHFKGIAFEIADGCLYVYSEHAKLSLTLLETVLKNGRWLAEAIDQSTTISASRLGD